MTSLRRLLELARPNLGAFGRVAALGFAIAALYVASAILIARTLADLLTGSDLADEAPLLLGAIGALVLRAAGLRFQDGLAASAAAEVKLAVRDRLYAQLLDLGPDWLTHARTGVLQSTVTDGVERLERVYSRLLAQTGVSFIVGLAITGYVISLDAVVGVIVLACLLAMPAMVILLKVAIRSSGTFWWGTYSEMYAEYLDSIQGMPTLKVCGASRRRGQELSTKANRLRDAAIRLAAGEISLYLLVYGAVGVATAPVLGIGALRVAGGAMAGTDLVLVLLLVRECFRPVNQLLAGFHAAYYGLIAARPMFTLLDTVPEVRNPERPRATSGATPPAVRFEQVSFGAPVAYAVWREDDDGVHVRQFFVVRDHRGCGVGRQAFALLGGEWAADDVKLDVLLHNERALMFWRSLGFRDYSLTLRRPHRYESPSADAASTQH